MESNESFDAKPSPRGRGRAGGGVRFKDSGVEWIGEIPEHWEVKRLKYAFQLQRGYDLSSDEFIDGPHPVCASNGIIGYHIHSNVKGPSITVGRSGSVGEVNYIGTDFWAHNTALYVKEYINTDTRFAYYLLLSIDLKSLSAGSAVGTLNRNNIHIVPIAIPPLSEQKTIAAYLDRETSRIDVVIDNIDIQISKLRELRQTLISNAVTGKIDVREDISA